MTTRKALLASAAAAALFSQSATAQGFDLGEIVVSGGFNPVDAQSYGRSASVVTGEEIETRGITTVQDALRALPGVSVSSQGNSLTQVRIRGGEANHTLILIDGVEAGGDGSYILSGLETLNVERIEVLRGPQSVFYGSNASAGVINIITDKGAEGTEARTRVEVGAGHTASATVSARGARGGLSFSLSDTYDEGWDFSGAEGEKDSTRRQTVLLSADVAPVEGLTFGLDVRQSSQSYDFDDNNVGATSAAGYVVDNPDLFSDRDEITGRLFAEYEMLDGRLVHRLDWQLTENEQSFSGGAPTETRSEALKYRFTYGLDAPVSEARQMLTFFVEDSEDSSSTNPDFDRSAVSYALEYQGSFDNGLTVQAGVRHDDNSVFEDATTWVLSGAYALESGVRLHASAGTGVVNPSYLELYGGFGFTGNPNLEPERNRSWDIGVEVPFAQGRGVVDLTYFDETLEDEITTTAASSYENQSGESTRRGVELDGSWAATEALDLRAAYTWLDAENPDGSVEIRRPEHELLLGATMQAFDGRGSVSADIRHVAGNFDTQFFGAFATRELPDYTTVDVAARYAIDDTFTLTGRVENLFDSEAVDSWGYVGRPRTAYVGLDATF